MFSPAIHLLKTPHDDNMQNESIKFRIVWYSLSMPQMNTAASHKASLGVVAARLDITGQSLLQIPAHTPYPTERAARQQLDNSLTRTAAGRSHSVQADELFQHSLGLSSSHAALCCWLQALVWHVRACARDVQACADLARHARIHSRASCTFSGTSCHIAKTGSKSQSSLQVLSSLT